jgi:hypothetical protein
VCRIAGSARFSSEHVPTRLCWRHACTCFKSIRPPLDFVVDRCAGVGRLSRLLGGVVLLAVGIAGCGGRDTPAVTEAKSAPRAPSSRVSEPSRAATPAASCESPSARRTIYSDLHPQRGSRAVSLGPLSLVIGPFRVGPRRVAAPKVTVAVAGRRAATLTVDRPSRRRFSLLFAGAGTSRPGTGFRIADGLPAVRFPACRGRGSTTFLGGAVLRGRVCVHLHATVTGKPERVLRGTLGCR